MAQKKDTVTVTDATGNAHIIEGGRMVGEGNTVHVYKNGVAVGYFINPISVIMKSEEA